MNAEACARTHCRVSTSPAALEDRRPARAGTCVTPTPFAAQLARVAFPSRSSLLAFVFIALMPLSVHAQRGIDLASPAAPTSSGFALDLGARLTAPLALGGMMQLEMPGRVFVRTEVGALPDGIAEGYANVAATLGGWDASTRASVRDALSGALFLETALGVRVVDGLELAVGYALLWTSSRFGTSGVGGTLETSNHAIHATIGWRALLFSDSAFFRIEAGWFHTLGASASVNLDQPVYEPSGLESEIAAALRARGFGPTLSVSVGLHLE